MHIVIFVGQIESKEIFVDLIPAALVAEDELDLSQRLAERPDEVAKSFVRSLRRVQRVLHDQHFEPLVAIESFGQRVHRPRVFPVERALLV